MLRQHGECEERRNGKARDRSFKAISGFKRCLQRQESPRRNSPEMRGWQCGMAGLQMANGVGCGERFSPVGGRGGRLR
jgi:hypothetical protein